MKKQPILDPTTSTRLILSFAFFLPLLVPFSLTGLGPQVLEGHSQSIPQPELTIEEMLQNLSARFNLTNEEQLILQPILNELAFYYRARQASFSQNNTYRTIQENKLKRLRESQKQIVAFGRESILKQTSLSEGLFELRKLHAANHIYDPSAEAKRAHSPPEPPWGWTRLEDLPVLRKEMEERNRGLWDRWNTGDYSIYFTWPGSSDWCSKNYLDEFVKGEEEKLPRATGQEPKAYSIHYPILGWTNQNQLAEFIKSAEAKLLETREFIRAGSFSIHSEETVNRWPEKKVYLVAPSRRYSGELTGWFTRSEIERRVTELEGKKVEVRAQYGKRTLKIFRQYPGWMTRTELEAQIVEIEAKRNEVRKQLEAGDYRVYFPGMGKWFSRNEVDEEIARVREKIKTVGNPDTYKVPVLGFGALSLNDIQALQKKKDLSKEQRVNLERGRGLWSGAKDCEKKYYERQLRHFDGYVRADVARYTHAGGEFLLGPAQHGGFEAFYRWEIYERKKLMTYPFSRELHHFDYYYDLRLDLLKKYLRLFG